MSELEGNGPVVSKLISMLRELFILPFANAPPFDSVVNPLNRSIRRMMVETGRCFLAENAPRTSAVVGTHPWSANHSLTLATLATPNKLHFRMLKRKNNDGKEEITDESDDMSSSSAESEHVPSHAQKNSKVLILSSRGINSRQRHLLNDFLNIIPHSVKESKFDSKNMLSELNELAELHGCTHCVFFEARKPQELFLWVSQCPNGPSAKFHVQSIYTVDELKTMGNFTFGTRPLLFFDQKFASGANQVIQELLTNVFNTPPGHRRGDRHDFFDHALNFSSLDGKIWVRQYQICEGEGQEGKGSGANGLSLTEIGPRFILNPIKVFDGSFRGKTLWENASYVTPAASRVMQRKLERGKHAQRQSAASERLRRKEDSYYTEDSDLE